MNTSATTTKRPLLAWEDEPVTGADNVSAITRSPGVGDRDAADALGARLSAEVRRFLEEQGHAESTAAVQQNFLEE